MSLDSESQQKLARCLIQLQDNAHEMQQRLESVSAMLMEMLAAREGGEPTVSG